VVSSGYGNNGGGVNANASTTSAATGAAGAGAAVDVDRKANEDLAAMSNERRLIVDAITEERARYVVSIALAVA
jgi:hypothetical protein